jgi:3-hydroxy acid dehydrogenase / malonic semialdehyde reductase
MAMQLRALDQGAIALVTGASSGIGAAIAEALVGAGGRVIAAARRLDRLSDLAAKLGAACHPLALDQTDDHSVRTLLERLPAAWRDIDIVINNAGHGIGGKRRFDAGTAEEWVGIIETNVSGMIRVSRAVIPGMLARGGGQIVNIGSAVGVQALPNDATYTTSKFAVHGFSKALRLDYLGRIRVIEVLPGLVSTEFDEVRRFGDTAAAEAYYASFPERLLPEDVASCVAFALAQPPRVTIAELLVLPSA